MIVDSSVWVDFLGLRPTAAARSVRGFLATGGLIYLTTTVVQEVLQGARHQAHFDSLARTLAKFPLCLPADACAAARNAAALYARCRWQGVTIRSPNDCLIAALAIECGQPVLAADRDFRLLRNFDSRLQLVDVPAEA